MILAIFRRKNFYYYDHSVQVYIQSFSIEILILKNDRNILLCHHAAINRLYKIYSMKISTMLHHDGRLFFTYVPHMICCMDNTQKDC